ncbi:MAG: SBBP repeat-containing protein, partial [Planctomycetota bacterium]
MSNSIIRSSQTPLSVESLEPRILLSIADESQALQVFSTSPALFVKNQGQWEDESIRYALQSSGLNVGFTDQGPVFHLFEQEQTEVGADSPGASDYITHATSFSVSFDGANAVMPVGLGRAETLFNYCMGGMSSAENVPSYRMVAYARLYEGIDLLMWGRQDGLKYEFHVTPGADYRDIRVSYDGAEGLYIDDEGALHIKTTLGELVESAPYVYQEINGQRVEVAGRFALADADTYVFEVTGQYDGSFDLIIDPSLAWSTYLGGSDVDRGYGVAVDGDGNVLVTGYTSSSGWVSGGLDTDYNGGQDIFVAKLSPSGAHLWSTYLGGSGVETGRGVAVDDDGNVLVTGHTYSSGWVAGGFDTSYNGDADVFVAKLSPSGTHLWSTYLGGASEDIGYGVTADGDGNVLVTGYTNSSNWVTGGFDTKYNGGQDTFVAKLSPSGAHLWSTYVGGSAYEIGCGVAADASGNVLVTGETSSSGWVSGGFDTSYNGTFDVFVAKLSPLGAHLWSTYLGGGSEEIGYGVAADGPGNVLVTGWTYSSGWVSDGFDTDYDGGQDAFVVKLSPSGAHVWSAYLGGSGLETGRGVAVDGTGNARVTGWTYSSDWVSGGVDTSYNGEADAFVVKLSPAGTHLWSTYLGGSGSDYGYGIAVDEDGNTLVAGYTDSSGWVSGGYDTSYNGGQDAFAAKISVDNTAAPTVNNITVTPIPDEASRFTIAVSADDVDGNLEGVAFEWSGDGINWRASHFYDPETGDLAHGAADWHSANGWGLELRLDDTNDPDVWVRAQAYDAAGLASEWFVIDAPFSVEVPSAMTDEFEGSAIDADKWTAADGEEFAGGNWAQAGNISVDSGVASFSMFNDSDPDHPLRGAQIVADEARSFGYYAVCMKAEVGNGATTGFFTYLERPGEGVSGNNLQEIDIEIFGEDPGNVYFTVWYNEPSVVGETGVGKRITANASADTTEWHEYAFVWHPDRIEFVIDGVRQDLLLTYFDDAETQQYVYDDATYRHSITAADFQAVWGTPYLPDRPAPLMLNVRVHTWGEDPLFSGERIAQFDYVNVLPYQSGPASDRVDFNGDGAEDLWRMDGLGQWLVTTSQGSTEVWGAWSTGVTWEDVRAADFTGDGKADIGGRTDAGQWWIAVSTGSAFVNEYWGAWAPINWNDVQAGDFTGDGKADIGGRTDAGQWWIAVSTGSAFVNEYWGAWAPINWNDVQAGDLNGDGKTDIIGRTNDGQWWAAVSSGSAFTNELWGTWAAIQWDDVRVGDFNGDGRTDMVGRTDYGQWWVAVSSGSAFTNELWGAWSTGVTWSDVRVGDFNDDGNSDL